MKIVIITPAELPVPAVFGGAVETLIEVFLKENEKYKLHEIFVYSKYNIEAYNASKNYLNAKFIWIKKGGLYKAINYTFRMFRKLRITKVSYDNIIVYHYITRNIPDVILVEGNPTYVRYLKDRLGGMCKIVLHIHALLTEGKYGYLSDALCYSDRVLVVSNYIKMDLSKRFFFDSVKMEVMHNCASQAFLNNIPIESDKLALKRDLGIEATDFVLIFAGRLVPDKGLFELIMACKRIIAHDFKIKLIIVGSFGSGFGGINNGKNDFQERIKKEIIGLEKFFIFCGYITHDIVFSYYSIANVAVIPSLCDDAAPLVAIEAMAASLPVIYSNKGGIKEYVSPKCGIMLDMNANNRIELISESILKLHNDEPLRLSMSNASFNCARLYSPEKYYENMAHFLKFK